MRKSPRLTKLYGYIRRSNARFKKMSIRDKRVQLAKDVLMQLETKRLKPEHTYFEAAKVDKALEVASAEDQQLQDVLKNTPRCQVCGIGALFVVAIDRLNEMKLWEWESRHNSARGKIHMYFEHLGIFTTEHLNWIEGAYEYNRLGIRSDYKRMQHIMEIIIEKKGVMTEFMFHEGWDK